MRIIKADLLHAEAIARICAEGWKQTVEEKLSEETQQQTIDQWYNLARVKRDIASGGYGYVAVRADEVVGVIGGSVTTPDTSEVFVLYVDEKDRYFGTGTMLLQALTQDHKQQGASCQWVSVQEGNQHGIPFYEATGFLCKEQRESVKDTGETHVILRYYREV
ncbi:GNAT family N-acetyltransferase [Terribacillus saccharophilus]|uniref:GNAT family N-acetyltransferase n=1 Tax=Terribacillus saccharophilus TaxID=361277 RepID=UPI003982B402